MALFRRRYTAPGAAPGTLSEGPAGAVVQVICHSFDLETWQRSEPTAVADVVALRDPKKTLWIEVQGLGDGSWVQELGAALGIHPLAVSDMHNVGQRPKVDPYDNGIFVVLRHLIARRDEPLEWQQVSMFLGGDFVLSVQEGPSEVLRPIEQRISEGRQLIRSNGPDYLLSCLIDAVVDAYFPILETWGVHLEWLEDQVLEGHHEGLLEQLYRTRRNLATLHRAALPMRSALDRMTQDDTLGFTSLTRLHLRDAADHANQVVDVDSSYRDLSTSLIDVHLSILGQRTNESMRLLTVIATVFILLTFFVGLYGMNFDTSQPWNMPELHSPYGYPLFLLFCFVVASTLMYVFYRLGWLGRHRGPN
ncbi:MAG: magnesium/cobalt transporter CorA [Planctomycetes bacterium]|nr:magnesium/cobalt transporter CorA [Planctomycetota bacterium]HPF13082.1 magnesium/cobalt transporter CorA [Planctomycetota bacterium]